MSLTTRCEKNELLGELLFAIEDRTHGRLSDLSIDVDNGAVLIEANSSTYHVVQLALAAIGDFIADFPQVAPSVLMFHVSGRPLVLRRRANQEFNGRTTPNNDSLFADIWQRSASPLAAGVACISHDDRELR